MFWPDLEKVFKLVQKLGMMWPLQDKEFVRHKIPKTGRTLKSVKTRPLRNWRKTQWNETMAASPAVGDVKFINKLARQIKSQPVKLQYWPLTGPLRTLGFPDASHRK